MNLNHLYFSKCWVCGKGEQSHNKVPLYEPHNQEQQKLRKVVSNSTPNIMDWLKTDVCRYSQNKQRGLEYSQCWEVIRHILKVFILNWIISTLFHHIWEGNIVLFSPSITFILQLHLLVILQIIIKCLKHFWLVNLVVTFQRSIDEWLPADFPFFIAAQRPTRSIHKKAKIRSKLITWIQICVAELCFFPLSPPINHLTAPQI